VAQVLLSAFAFRDVRDDADDSGDMSGGVTLAMTLSVNPMQRRVGPADAAFQREYPGAGGVLESPARRGSILAYDSRREVFTAPAVSKRGVAEYLVVPERANGRVRGEIQVPDSHLPGFQGEVRSPFGVINPGHVVLQQLRVVPDRLLGACARGDVLRHDQRGGVPGKGDRVRRDVHVDDLAGLQAVAPVAGILPGLLRLTGLREQSLDILGGADVGDRHRSEE